MSSDPNETIKQAADAIVAEQPISEDQRLQAAGLAAQQAADSGNTHLLDLLILVGAGEYNAALHLLVNMSVPASVPSAAASSPFANLLNAGKKAASAPPSSATGKSTRTRRDPRTS